MRRIFAGVALVILGLAVTPRWLEASAQQQQPTGTPAAALAAPPRSIADIVAILDQEKPDPARRARLIAAAEAAEPPGLDSRQRSLFLYERAQAANLIGRADAALADLEPAIALGTSVGADVYRMQQLYAGLLRMAGKPQESLAYYIQLAETEAKGRLKGRLFNVYRSIVQGAVTAGNFAMAKRYLDQAEYLYREISTNTRGPNNFMFLSSWQTDIDLAKALVASSRGQYGEAEAATATALQNNKETQQRAKHWPDPPAAGTIESGGDLILANLGDMKLAQGRMTEAEVDIRQALLNNLRRDGKYSFRTATFASSLSNVLLEQGRLAEAEKMARTAAEIFREIGYDENAPAALATLRAVANTLALQRRWPEVAELYEKMIAATADWSEGRARVIRRSPARILMLARTGRGNDAADVASQMVKLKSERMGEKHFEVAMDRGLLGIALASAGRDSEAVAAFRDAVPVLLSASRQAETEETGLATRDFFVQTIIEDYIVLLARVQGTPAGAGINAGSESFRLADAARGRNVQRALAASAARAAVRDPKLAELVRQEQDQQKQIAAQFGLLSNLLALPPEQRDDKAILAMRKDVDSLRDSRAKTRQQIEQQFPDYVNLIDPRPPAVDEMRAVLRDGEALVSFYLAQENSFVWVVPKQGAVAFAAAPLGAKVIEAKVQKLRLALEPQAETLGDIPAFDLTLAHELYATLLQPVEAGWKPAKSLFVVTNGALGLLPLALLPTAPAQVDIKAAPLFDGYKSVPWLARSHAVTQLPSTAALKTLRGLPAGGAKREPLVGFGDPFFNAEQAAEAATEAPLQIASADPVAVRGAKLKRRSAPQTTGVDSAELGLLPRLPDTADELRSVALAMQSDPAKALFLGKQANEKTVQQTRLDNYRVVAFATHGLVPGDLNGLTQPALALTAPQVADVDGDGLLTMDEILGLKLDADWVVLSACNTGTGAGAGAEAASGLGRAFFYAGTRALLLTNWSVHSASARDLVTDLFRRQAADAKLGRAEALRRAMVSLLDGPGYQENGQTLFSYAHPIFWAPYSLMGDGG